MLQAADVLLVNEQPGVRGMALPSKLTSYFAAGRPVLAATGRESATAAELRRSNAGERVDAGDPAALLDAVERLVADPDRMHALARAGLEYRRTTLSEKGAGQRFERVLHSLPTRHGEPPVPQPAVTAPIELPTAMTQAVLRGDVIGGRTATRSQHRPAH
jgi:colanic acid biosynthesis glycosyl transferase WcaI